jgi:hypothetical protein
MLIAAASDSLIIDIGKVHHMERLNAEQEGSWELYPTEVGKSLLAKLYKDGKLQMKNS